NAWHAVGVESQSAQYVNDVCGVVGLLSNSFYQAINTLNGGNGCTNVAAASSYSTTYSSDVKVVLSPGFNAQAGCHFTAYVEPCAITMYRSIVSGNNNLPVEGSQQKISATAEDKNSLVSVSPNPFQDNLKVSAMLNEGETI